jgi:tRNA(Ile)-lysidine synthase
MPEFTFPLSMHDLSPAAARLCLDVRRFLRTDFALAPKAWPLCVAAVSGGADSLALALIAHYLKIPLIIAHLDHSLRPESSDEAAFVECFARALSYRFVSQREDVRKIAATHGIGLEEAGRATRYAFLEKVRANSNADWILTGHHLNDLGEDIIMRLIRGAGWPALGGMSACDAKRRILRPLLTTPKERLYAFLQSLGLKWREDASNALADYLRNRVRNSIMPLLKAENPSFDQTLAQLWKQAGVDEQYWDDVLKDIHAQPCNTGLLLKRDHIAALPRAARLRLYIKTIREFGRGQAGAAGLHKLETAFTAPKNGTLIQFSGKLYAEVHPEGIIFSTNQPVPRRRRPHQDRE